MRKIQTIFDRDWEGNRKCIDQLAVNPQLLAGCFATEKIDGMNIRLTMRSGEVMRVEKRRNPNKEQKGRGITEPWYVDAHRSDKQDKWIFDAVDHTDLSHIPDGEWSAEAFGKNVQGNPLQLEHNRVFVFSCPGELKKIILPDAPTDYAGLKTFLHTQTSIFNKACSIEGVVWHDGKGNMFKIKKKDFN